MYDQDVSYAAHSDESGEDLFFSLALADLTRAAELFQPVFARTDGVDGWVSLVIDVWRDSRWGRTALGELIHHRIAGDLTEAAALALKAAWTLT